MIALIRRYRQARRLRTCPKCHGKGTDIIDTILRDNFRERPCRLCNGDGRVRYKRGVAFGFARRGLIDAPEDEAA